MKDGDEWKLSLENTPENRVKDEYKSLLKAFTDNALIPKIHGENVSEKALSMLQKEIEQFYLESVAVDVQDNVINAYERLRNLVGSYNKEAIKETGDGAWNDDGILKALLSVTLDCEIHGNSIERGIHRGNPCREGRYKFLAALDNAENSGIIIPQAIKDYINTCNNCPYRK
jgi:hypothetical protein